MGWISTKISLLADLETRRERVNRFFDFSQLCAGEKGTKIYNSILSCIKYHWFFNLNPVTGDDLQKIEQKLGFPLPAYYRATMVAYPFSDYEYTSKYFLADNLNAVIKNNSKKSVEGFSKVFIVGCDPEGEQYFVDATKSDSPVYALDLGTGKYAIKAKSWEEFLNILRADIKDLEDEIAAEREQERQPRLQANQNIWTKNLSPAIWPWLGPVLGVVLIYGGIKAIITEDLRYRPWVYHGAAAIIGGIGMLLWAYVMFRAGFIIKSRKWNNFDLVAGIGAVIILLGLKWKGILW